MNTRKAALVGVGTILTAGLALGGTVAANAATVDNAAIKSTTASTSGTDYTVLAKQFTDGATAKITLTGTSVDYTSVTKKKVADNGTVSYTFAATRAGVYTVKITADGESATKKVTVGTAYTAATVDADNTSDKTTTIDGTAVANSTVVVKVYKDGDIVSNKTVAVDSSGDYTSTFAHASDDGTYKVKVTYKATATKYGAHTYTDTFTRS
jgi:hypothetical protein